MIPQSEIVRWACAFGREHQYEALAKGGATDAQLLRMVEQMGNGGFTPVTLTCRIEVRADPPRIWYDDDGETVTMDAGEIVAELRRTFRIAQPKAEQVRLF